MEPIVASAIIKAGEFGEKVADSAAKDTGSLLARLSGPSADVIGLKWADRLRERNLERLLKKTESHAGEEGFADARVASQVFESAEYADSEVVAEYLSGIFASSRDGDGQDGSGVQWSAIIARLSSDQLLHYLVYASIRRAVLNNPPGESQ